MIFFRILLVGGALAYRALFHWIKPTYYFPTMLGIPLFQILFFVYLGRYTHTASTDYFVVGNSVQACAMAGIYGMIITIGTERWYGTLGSILVTPANRFALFVGRALPNVAQGMIVSGFGFLVGVVLLHFRMPLHDIPALVLVTLVTAASCTAFGLFLGAFGLRARDIFFIASVSYFLMLLLCNVNVPRDRLPEWLRVVGGGLPLTHGIAAARSIVGGGGLGGVAGNVAAEVVVGVAWAAVAYLSFRLLEREGYRRGALDVI